MSDSQVFVDTDRLDVMTPQFRELADHTRGTLQTLLGLLAGLEEAPGNDAAGKAFKETYQPIRAQVVEALQTFPKILDGMHEGVRTMSRGYNQTEAANTIPSFGGVNGADKAPKAPPAVKP